MKKKRKYSGIRRRYLKYTLALLALALFLCSIGVGIFVRWQMIGVVTDKYEFMTERMGIALDTLYKKTDEVTAECILYENVQKSLRTGGLEEVGRIPLSKYFAYVELEYIADYCYVDNHENVYSKLYSNVTYEDVKESGVQQYLGTDYSKTKWFWTKDRLFGTEEEALFIGRYVRNMDYAHEPGMLFFKMDPRFLEEITNTGYELEKETATGIIDPDGNLCLSTGPQVYQEALKQTDIRSMLEDESGTGLILKGVAVDGGILSAYRQSETGLILFSFVPDAVLNRGMSRMFLILGGIYLFVIVTAVIMSMYFSQRFTKPIQVINDAMTGFDGNDFDRTIELHTNTELDEIGNSYNKMLGNIQKLLEEIKLQEKELRTSELNMLINQVNPHFLYNTLDTIYMLARINKEERTMRMIQALSKYLRLSLSKGSDIVTIEDELENVKSYMEIQQIRNENLFTYEVDVQVNTKKTWILKLILQPLVENSVKYGFCDIFEGGIIRIVIWKEEDMLCLSVFNNGTPIEPKMAEKIRQMNTLPIASLKECFPDKQHGYGIVNIMTRLRLKYGDGVCVNYLSKTDGTTCVIKIPRGGKGEEDEE